MFKTIVFDIKRVLYPFSEEAEFVIADLKSAGYKLAVISSMSPKLINEVMCKYGIGQGVFAGDTKFSKRDPELYKYFLEKYDLKAEECLMVDDTQEKLLAAHKAGIKTCWLKLEDEVKREGVDYVVNNLKNILVIASSAKQGNDILNEYEKQKAVC